MVPLVFFSQSSLSSSELGVSGEIGRTSNLRLVFNVSVNFSSSSFGCVLG